MHLSRLSKHTIRLFVLYRELQSERLGIFILHDNIEDHIPEFAMGFMLYMPVAQSFTFIMIET